MQSLQRNKSITLFCTFLLSLFLVGFGRPSDLPIVSYAAATVGYALLWKQLLTRKNQLSLLWLFFGLTSLLQTRWLLSHPYSYIIAVWLFLSLVLSFPFALLIKRFLSAPLSWSSLIQTSAFFALIDILETKLFFCGISFRTPGAFFMGNLFSSQLITLLGGYGLSFLVCFMNGALLIQKRLIYALLLLIAPLALGACLNTLLPKHQSTTLKIAVLHSNKEAEIENTAQRTIASYKESWLHFFSHVPYIQKAKCDLIILPEGAFAFSSETAILSRKELPPKIAQYIPNNDSLVSSSELSQAIARFCNSSLLVGMERRSFDRYYNSCFLFSPNKPVSFYDKQVLVPGGEYVPFEELLKPLLLQYGITGSFGQGAHSTLLVTPKATIFPLICYEETLPQYVLPAVDCHADLLISISNDHWFPSEQFAKEHWLLGKMRAMEAGLSLVRSSTMGKSGALLADGTEVQSNRQQSEEEVLTIEFLPQKRCTLFSLLHEEGTALFFCLLALGTLYPSKKIKRQ